MAEKNDNIQVQTEKVENTGEKDAQAKRKKRVTKKAQPSKTLVVKSKRKEAIARAYIKKGSGRITFNSKDVNVIESNIMKAFILEPLSINSAAKEYVKSLDININVRGGGISAQMQAARGAIAKGLVKFTEDEALKRAFLNYNRALLVDDPRRVEPKKFKGPKARARFQTSYR
ncbi:MAG: 30S ribosomal protein S9 [Candidatus Micrarchaeia archaeon]